MILIGLVTLASALVGPGGASSPARDDAPPLVGTVEILVQDVFEDTGETPDAWPYRVANQLHVETKEDVVRRELLFKEGDALDPGALAETERNLRALPFLREARVETLPPGEDGAVPVRVVVSDSWSTTPEARVAKVGNDWVWALGASERNLLGRGIVLQALHNSGLDRDENLVLYRDPRLLGSRV